MYMAASMDAVSRIVAGVYDGNTDQVKTWTSYSGVHLDLGWLRLFELLYTTLFETNIIRLLY